MSFLGNIFGGGPSNDQKQSNNLLNYNAQQAKPIADNAINNANTAFGTGNGLVSTGQTFFNAGNGTVNQGLGYLNQAQNALNSPSNYFQQLLSGNQQKTTQALAPQINQIRGQQQNALQATTNLAPRGGGRSSTLFNLPFQANSQIAGAYNGSQANAANALTGIAGLQSNAGLGTGALGTNIINAGTSIVNSGTGQGGLGEGLLGQASNAYNTGNNAAGIYGNQAYQQQGMRNQIGQQAGAGIGQLVSNIPTLLNMFGF